MTVLSSSAARLGYGSEERIDVPLLHQHLPLSPAVHLVVHRASCSCRNQGIAVYIIQSRIALNDWVFVQARMSHADIRGLRLHYLVATHEDLQRLLVSELLSIELFELGKKKGDPATCIGRCNLSLGRFSSGRTITQASILSSDVRKSMLSKMIMLAFFSR